MNGSKIGWMFRWSPWVAVAVAGLVTAAGCFGEGADKSEGTTAVDSDSSKRGVQPGGSGSQSTDPESKSAEQVAGQRDENPAPRRPNAQKLTLNNILDPQTYERPPQPVAPAEWLMFRGDTRATGVSPASLSDDLQVAWELKIQNGGFDGSPVISEGTVFLAEGRGILYALELETGEVKWQYPPRDSDRELLGFIASPAIHDGRLYIGDLNGVLHCLTLDGEPEWEFESEVQFTSSVNFYKDAVIVGGEDANLYCIEMASGQQRWAFEAQDQIRCMPTIANGQAFVTGCDGNLHIIDLETGQESRMVELKSPTIASPAVLGKRVFFGTGERGFLAVDIENGEIAWSFPDNNQIYSSPAVVERDGRQQVIYGSRMRKVLSLDGQTGELQWEHETDRDVDASPVVVGDRVLAASGGGMLYLLDLATGDPVWQQRFEGQLWSAPAVTDGRVVIATGRGSVYCLINPLAQE